MVISQCVDRWIVILISVLVHVCVSHMAAGLWLAAVTLHDVVEGVSLFGDL